MVADFLDWSRDNFDNFKDLDGSLTDLHFGFSAEASSWRWFTPVGTRMRADDDDFGDDSFPGLHTRTPFGTRLRAMPIWNRCQTTPAPRPWATPSPRWSSWTTSVCTTAAPVRVVNVAPTITLFGVFNSLNQQLGPTVPFCVEGPLPCVVVHRSGQARSSIRLIHWGDGESTASGAFDSFSDAFGGLTGRVEPHAELFRCRYLQPDAERHRR